VPIKPEYFIARGRGDAPVSQVSRQVSCAKPRRALRFS